MGFSESPIVQKIALILFPLSCLLEIIGLASPYWISVSDTIQGQTISINIGLWKGCYFSVCGDITNVQDWFNGVRALEILGMLAVIAATLFTALSIFMSSESMQKMGKLVAVATGFAAAGLILIGVVIFAAKLDDLDPTGTLDYLHYLSWAFGLCIAAAILSGIGGILSILAICR